MHANDLPAATFNEEPNALLWNAKLWQQYSDVYDTTNQPLRAPAEVDALQRFVTNQIESFTQGTMTDRATDLFVGDFTKLLIGQRLDFTVQTLTERYAELGQVGSSPLARRRAAARPRAFAVYRYLQGRCDMAEHRWARGSASGRAAASARRGRRPRTSRAEARRCGSPAPSASPRIGARGTPGPRAAGHVRGGRDAAGAGWSRSGTGPSTRSTRCVDDPPEGQGRR